MVINACCRPVPTANAKHTSHNAHTHKTSKSLWKIWIESLKTVSGAKDLFKTYICFSKGAELAGAQLSSRVQGVTTIARTIKNGLEATELPKSMGEICSALRQFKFRKALDEMVHGIHVLYDITEVLLSNAVVTISKVAMRQFSFINSLSLIYVQGKDALKHFADITRKKSMEVNQLAMLKLAKAVSYVGLGIFGVIGFIANVTYPAWVFYAWATSALAFSHFSRFHAGVHGIQEVSTHSH